MKPEIKFNLFLDHGLSGYVAFVANGAELFATAMKAVCSLQQYCLFWRALTQFSDERRLNELLPGLLAEWSIQRLTSNEKVLMWAARYANRVQFIIKPAATMGKPTDQTGIEVDVEFYDGAKSILQINLGWFMHEGVPTSCNLCMESRV